MAPTPEAAAHAEKVVDASVEKWDSYVCELGRAEGEFLGGGAEVLGLHGAPENGATWSLMNGIHPVTGERFHTPYWTKVSERLLIDETGTKKRLVSAPSYAAVFAAPKSVSMLLATGFRDETLESWRAAVAEGTRFLDSQWRVRDRSGSHESLGLIATSYEHHTPRLEDPECHLHTHLTIMNFGQRASDGKFLAGDFAHYLRLQKAAGIVVQAALRAELARRIPAIKFELHDNGTADIAQIPTAVRERFSTRRGKVLEEDRAAAERGIGPGFRRMDYATYKSRSSKHVLDPREWLEKQRDALAELGIDDEAIAAWADQDRTVVQASWEVRRQELGDRLFGPEGLTEKRNTFNRWDVMERVGMAHYTDMESFEQLIARTDELLADPRVVAVGEKGRYTVTDILEMEGAVLEAQRRVRPRAAARSGRRAIVRDMITEAEARQGWVFNDGQRAMIEGIVTSGNQVEVVEALAGTGKTKSLGMLAEILEADGVHVIGAAPTGRARLELIQEAGISDSYTLASLKVRRENGEQIFDRSRPFVLAVDEAGFSATRELADVFQDAIAAGGRILLVGDSGQLGSVGAGGLFAAISRERAADEQFVYRLTDVMRQRTRGGAVDELEVHALEALHCGSVDEWIALREERGQLHVHVGRDAGVLGIEHAANLYLEALARNNAKDLYLLSADNVVRDTVNTRVRDELVARGVIVEAGEIGGRGFAEGERITLRDNDNPKTLVNGMRATILSVDAEAGTLTVAIDGKHARVEMLDYEYVTGFTENGQQRVQGGYANTIHTSQGGTANVTIIVGAAQSLDKQRGYVAASRARHATHLVTWDGSAPEYFAEHELTDIEQTQKVREQLFDALQRSGVEPSATEQMAEAGEQLQLNLEEGSSEHLGEEQDFEIDLTPEQEAALQRAEGALIDDSEELRAWEAAEAAAQARLSAERELGAAAEVEARKAAEQAAPDLSAQAAAQATLEAELAPHRQKVAELWRQLAEAEQTCAEKYRVHETASAEASRLGKQVHHLDYAGADLHHNSVATQIDTYGASLRRQEDATTWTERREAAKGIKGSWERLPDSTRARLDQFANSNSFTHREAIDALQQLRQQTKQLRQQADAAQASIDWISRKGGELDQLRAEISAVERVLDPGRAIDDRLSKTLETNQYFRRPPSSLEEANVWSREWNYGLVLEEQEGVMHAGLSELPSWRQPLTGEQRSRFDLAIQQGHDLGHQLKNLDITPREAARTYQRGQDSGHGINS